MNDDLKQLELECSQAADEFLALDWGYSKNKVRSAVQEMLSGSKLYTSSMGWLLKESAKLPVQAEPARRLNDLVVAISVLRARKLQHEAFSPAESARDVA